MQGKTVLKNRNGQILNTFWPYLFWLKLLKSVKLRICTTSPSFLNSFLLIFQICTVQWLNCKNLKYELNRSYNGVVVVYLRKSEASHSSLQYANFSLFQVHLLPQPPPSICIGWNFFSDTIPFCDRWWCICMRWICIAYMIVVLFVSNLFRVGFVVTGIVN